MTARKVPAVFTTGLDRHNAGKAWLNGYDHGVDESKKLSSIDPARQRLDELIATWRAKADDFADTIADTGVWSGQAHGLRRCADELAALLPGEAIPPEPMRNALARLLDNLYGLHFRPGHLDALLQVIQVYSPTKVPVQADAGIGPAPTEPDVQLLAWAVTNCHMLARRRINAASSETDWWSHVLRICEKAGARSQGVLRASLPTELTEGAAVPAPAPCICTCDYDLSPETVASCQVHSAAPAPQESIDERRCRYGHDHASPEGARGCLNPIALSAPAPIKPEKENTLLSPGTTNPANLTKCRECGAVIRWTGLYGDWCATCRPRG